jgi:hypothetical protein
MLNLELNIKTVEESESNPYLTLENKNSIMEEILTYILKFSDDSMAFQHHLNLLLQKLIYLSDLSCLKVSSILLMFSRLPGLLSCPSKESLSLSYLSTLNNVLILTLDRTEFRSIWGCYVGQIEMADE